MNPKDKESDDVVDPVIDSSEVGSTDIQSESNGLLSETTLIEESSAGQATKPVIGSNGNPEGLKIAELAELNAGAEIPIVATTPAPDSGAAVARRSSVGMMLEVK